MQQMAWREALDDAVPTPTVRALDDRWRSAKRRMLAELTDALDDARHRRCRRQVRALMFVARFREDIDRRLEKRCSTR
jgi:molecular chaperone HscB